MGLMPGLKTVIPTAFTDTSLPILRDDPLLTPGSLVLVEAGHPLGGLGTGDNSVPVAGATVPNIAWREAAAALGSGDVNTLRLAVSISGYTNPTLAKIERTAKRGLHSITSKTIDPSNGTNFFHMTPPLAIRQFILDNTGANSGSAKHKFYTSAWVRQTRVGFDILNNFAVLNEFTSITGQSSNYILYTGQATNPQGSQITPDRKVNGPQFSNTANAGYWTGTPAANDAGLRARMGNLGMADMYSYTPEIRMGQADLVLYRVYLEDLTVSGRTYSQVSALDQQMFTDQVLTSGGRYYGDTTPTDPTTIP